MKQELKNKLAFLAEKYEVAEFIMDDPIQFPHRYTGKADIEISALVASWIATGNRKAIIKSGDRIDRELFSNAPYRYILSEEWKKYRGVKPAFIVIIPGMISIYFVRLCMRPIRNMKTWSRICAIRFLRVLRWKDCNPCSDISMGCLLWQVLPKRKRCVCSCAG